MGGCQAPTQTCRTARLNLFSSALWVILESEGLCPQGPPRSPTRSIQRGSGYTCLEGHEDPVNFSHAPRLQIQGESPSEGGSLPAGPPTWTLGLSRLQVRACPVPLRFPGPHKVISTGPAIARRAQGTKTKGWGRESGWLLRSPPAPHLASSRQHRGWSPHSYDTGVPCSDCSCLTCVPSGSGDSEAKERLGSRCLPFASPVTARLGPLVEWP